MAADEIDAEIRRLARIAHAIQLQIAAEQQAIYSKRYRLNTINLQLSRISPLAIPAIIGATVMGKESGIERLVRERDRLMNEISREESRLARLSNELSAITKKIKELEYRKAEVKKIITERTIAAQRREAMRKEIEWLIEELRRALIAGDRNLAETIRRRLREYGVQV